MRRTAAERWLWIVAGLAALFLLLAPRIPQDPAYHRFADARALFGIPNFWNTVSNLAFLPVGLAGLRRATVAATRVLFAGVSLVTVGSGYYHWAPSHETLFWDRLPMTLVFMAVTAMAIREWTGKDWLWPLTLVGIASVVWWRGTGDLRLYGLVQFGPALILIPAAVACPSLRGLGPAALYYALAKAAEAVDAFLFTHSGMGGHAIKHVLAAVATYWIYRWATDGTLLTEARHRGEPGRVGA